MAVTFLNIPPRAVYCRGDEVIYDVGTDTAEGTPNLRIWLELKVYDLDDNLLHTYKYCQEAFTLGANFGARFYVQEQLHDLFKEMDLPEIGNDGLQICTGVFKFTASAYEISGTDLTQSATEDTGITSRVYWGGIAWEHDNNNLFLTTRMAEVAPLIPFLSWAPVKINLGTDQPQWLYYYVYSAAFDSLVVRLTVYDFGTGEVTADSDPFSCAQYDVVMVPVGAFNWSAIEAAFGGYAGVRKYTVQLFSGGSPCSEIRTFYLDQKYYRNIRYFFFQNSLYGLDTLRVFSETEDKTERKFTLVNRISLRDGAYIPKGQDANRRPVIQKQRKTTTSELTLAEVKWLDDLLVSPHVFELVDDRMLPIRITSASISKFKDNDFRRTMAFEYEYAFHNQVHTPVPVIIDSGGGGGSGGG